MWNTTLAQAFGSAIGSFVAVLGAMVIFYLETRRGRKENRRERERELLGISLLLYSEVNANRYLLESYEQGNVDMETTHQNLSSANWELAKDKTVALAPPEFSVPLINYYRFLKSLLYVMSRFSNELSEGEEKKLEKRRTYFVKKTLKENKPAERVIHDSVKTYDNKYGTNFSGKFLGDEPPRLPS